MLINIFTLDPDQTERFVATQVGEYKRLKGQFSGSYTANLHISLDRTRAANHAHFTSVEDYVAMRNSPEFADHLQRLQGLVVKIANMIAFLASKNAQWVSGQTMPMNGSIL